MKEYSYNPLKHKTFDFLTFTSHRRLESQAKKFEAFYQVKKALRAILNFSQNMNSGYARLVIDSDCSTVQLRIDSQKISVQLRGSFWLNYREKAFPLAQLIFKNLSFLAHQSEEIQLQIEDVIKNFKITKEERIIKLIKLNLPNWLVTRSDIKQDYLNKSIIDIFPIKKSKCVTLPEEYHATFKYELRLHSETENQCSGAYLKGDQFHFLCYDKYFELKKKRNNEKLNQIIQSYGLNEPFKLVRAELRLNGWRKNQDITGYLIQKFIFKGPSLRDQEIISKVLQRFYLKKRILIKHPNKAKRSWKPEKRFHSFMTGNENLKIQLPKKVPIPQRSSNEEVIMRGLSMFSNAITAEEFKSLDKPVLSKQERNRLLDKAMKRLRQAIEIAERRRQGLLKAKRAEGELADEK